VEVERRGGHTVRKMKGDRRGGDREDEDKEKRGR
jgi:hypothetical protein